MYCSSSDDCDHDMICEDNTCICDSTISNYEVTASSYKVYGNTTCLSKFSFI